MDRTREHRCPLPPPPHPHRGDRIDLTEPPVFTATQVDEFQRWQSMRQEARHRREISALNIMWLFVLAITIALLGCPGSRR